MGSQPAGIIPITPDISGMLNNVPWEEGKEAFKEALGDRQDKSVLTDFCSSW